MENSADSEMHVEDLRSSTSAESLDNNSFADSSTDSRKKRTDMIPKIVAEDDISTETAVMRVEVTQRKRIPVGTEPMKEIGDDENSLLKSSSKDARIDNGKVDNGQEIVHLNKDQINIRPANHRPRSNAVVDKQNDKKSTQSLHTQERQDGKYESELLSSDDDALLLHRPEFYSILSDDDSFEWTFHNEKFSDLDIKFIPRVEKRWSDAKARTSLKGHLSESPHSSSDGQEKLVQLPGSEEKSTHLRKKKPPMDNLQDGKLHQKLSFNLEAVKSKIESSEKTNDIYKFYERNTESDKQAKHDTEATATNVRKHFNPQTILKSNQVSAINSSDSQAKARDGNLTKQFQKRSIRKNVVFFQSSPTLTYKKTKLKFLEDKDNDSPRQLAHGPVSDNTIMWSSKARMGKENELPMRYRKHEISLEKVNELYQRRNAFRKLCKLDDVEAKFISGTTQEGVTKEPVSFLPNKGGDKDRRGSYPNITIASSLDSSRSKAPSRQISDTNQGPHEAKHFVDLEKVGKRRSAKDVMQWLFEGRLSEAAKLRRRRSSKDLTHTQKNLWGTSSRPGPLRQWQSYPPSSESGDGLTPLLHSPLV